MAFACAGLSLMPRVRGTPASFEMRAAGCVMTLPDGAPFLYGKRGRPGLADFANPSFIAASDPCLTAGCRVAG